MPDILGRNHPATLLADEFTRKMVMGPFMRAAEAGELQSALGPKLRWSSAAVVNCTFANMSASPTGYVQYALTEWVRSGRPYWVLTPEVVAAMLKTDPPLGLLTELPPLPHRCLYVEVPKGSYTIFNDETGEHDAWGFYLVEDQILYDPARPDLRVGRAGRAYDMSTARWRRALSLIGVGEVRSAADTPFGTYWDDALVFGKWADPEEIASDTFPLIQDTWRIAINLLMALMNNYVSTREEKPLSAKKSPKKRKVLERRGICDHTVISLSGKGRSAKLRPKEASFVTGRAVTPHTRRGHWRRVWRLDPADYKVLEVQERVDRAPLHAVARWIPPTVVGGNDPAPAKKTIIKP